MQTDFKFKLNDKIIELSEDDAKELYSKFHELFGIKEFISYPVCPTVPYKIYPELPYNPSSYPGTIYSGGTTQ